VELGTAIQRNNAVAVISAAAAQSVSSSTVRVQHLPAPPEMAAKALKADDDEGELADTDTADYEPQTTNVSDSVTPTSV
jgi:hypothetical protein